LVFADARSEFADMLLSQGKSSKKKDDVDAVLSDAPNGKLVLTQSFR
jgi:hypothetical protein